MLLKTKAMLLRLFFLHFLPTSSWGQGVILYSSFQNILFHKKKINITYSPWGGHGVKEEIVSSLKK